MNEDAEVALEGGGFVPVLELALDIAPDVAAASCWETHCMFQMSAAKVSAA